MTPAPRRKISSNPKLMKRLAKYLAQQCFRNTMLENLHAGITPSSQTGDYTDVVVRVAVRGDSLATNVAAER